MRMILKKGVRRHPHKIRNEFLTKQLLNTPTARY
jgi:hypothetical protein